MEQQHILKGDVAVGSRHLPDTLATHRLTARQSVGFFRLYGFLLLSLSAHRKVARNRPQTAVALRLPTHTPARPHSGPQGQTGRLYHSGRRLSLLLFSVDTHIRSYISILPCLPLRSSLIRTHFPSLKINKKAPIFVLKMDAKCVLDLIVVGSGEVYLNRR